MGIEYAGDMLSGIFRLNTAVKGLTKSFIILLLSKTQNKTHDGAKNKLKQKKVLNDKNK